MSALTKFVLKDVKLNRKRSIGILIGITLSVMLICTVACIFSSYNKTMLETDINASGYWHLSLSGIDEAKLEKLNLNKNVDMVKSVYNNYYQYPNQTTNKVDNLTISFMDEETFNYLKYQKLDGNYPQSEYEILVSKSFLKKINKKIGDEISLTEEHEDNIPSESIGTNDLQDTTTVMETLPIKYRIVGTYNGVYFDNTAISTNRKKGDIDAYVVLQDPHDYKDALANILEIDKFDYYLYENGKLANTKYIYELNDVLMDEVHPLESKPIQVALLEVVLIIIIIIIIFLCYEYQRSKEINDIIKLLERINYKDYQIDMTEISEDYLSILRQEVYKTAILLNSMTDNALQDKQRLKESLQDISHQIKTPITSILINLDLLIYNYDMEDAKKRDVIRKIKRETNNINELVQYLLKLARFDVNAIKFNNDQVLIRDIINSTLLNVSTLCELKNIHIKKQINNQVSIYADKRWQIEAITNILKNSIEYSNQNGKIIIKVLSNQSYTLISIKNFGKKISNEKLLHIFDRFSEASDLNNGNIGLGLSLTKKILEMNNGLISVKSTDTSTEFIIKYFKL